MRLDKFTQKAQEAVLEAQDVAQQFNHPNVEPEHLLQALIVQEGGVVPSVIKKIGTDLNMLGQSVQQALAKLPRATGSSVQVGLSRPLNDILQEAQAIAE